MASLNKITVIGNLGSEPEMRFTPSGKPVTNFAVATNHKYTTGEGERREEVMWFTIVAWGKLAETCNQFLTKGQQVYVEGRLGESKWTDNEGQERHKLEITANTVLFLGAKGERQQVEESSVEKFNELEPGDIPF